MFGLKKNNNSKTDNNQPNNTKVEVFDKAKEIRNTEFFKSYQQKKKDLLPEGAITREELLMELEKQFNKKSINSSNPFKTREDMFFLFYNSNMQLNRPPVPFEEITIGGKKFYVNKKFENGMITINDVFASPDIEINLKEEYAKKETTKKQLEKINKEISFVKNKIAEGDERYKLIDIEDLKEEKWKLEKILDSIKFGKQATFIFENPINNKKSYMLRFDNGEYKYLKVTENNYITEENNIKFLKGYEIQKRLEEIANLRISKNWKQIFIGILIFVGIICTIFVLFKLATFEEELFDKRVKEYCGDTIDQYREEIKYYQGFSQKHNDVDDPSYKQQI